MGKATIQKFIQDQLSVWPLAAQNFRSLKTLQTRRLEFNKLSIILQHNPERIASSTSKTDSESLKRRPCFLCMENQVPEQMHLVHEARKGRIYNIQINPYPVFPKHLVICRDRHIEQSIWHNFVDMADLARAYSEYTITYNGPKCGASAPDHFHFQAVPRKSLPLECVVDAHLDLRDSSDALVPIASIQDASLFHYNRYANGIFILRSNTVKSLSKLFYRLLDCVPMQEGDKEPGFNAYCWYKGGQYRTMVILRSRHCSSHYDSADPAKRLTMRPGAVDMAGVFICPVREDFEKLDAKLLQEMISEVTISSRQQSDIISKLSRRQPSLDVGIMSAKEIEFEIISDGAGRQKVEYRDGRIDFGGVLYDELYFDAQTPSAMFAKPSFILYDVTIGVDFHWERKRDEKFAGSLKFIVEGDRITAINTVGVEEYLLSVISSEMKASASLELLKAHAVISRSWVYKMMRRERKNSCERRWERGEDGVMRICTWFDTDNHSRFHVCADDHCQRYQGLTMAIGNNVRKAIDETWGEVLMYKGALCDTRFAKCCGGHTETFSTCWEDTDFPYLTVVEDEFCNTSDTAILSQVLNDYDLETKDFHDWEVSYTIDQLTELFSRRSGCMIGRINNLIPLHRGPGGHIDRLKVVGSENSVIIGKELVIRRYLSESHLKSSNFEVRFEGDIITLRGKGWGHGVGLCQIGAAVMGAGGYSYRDILEHYYPGSEIALDENN